MYHLIGVVYQIRRYTGVYRLLCMLLFPGLSLPRGSVATKNAHGAGSEQPSSGVGSTPQKNRKLFTVHLQTTLNSVNYAFMSLLASIPLVRLKNRAWRSAAMSYTTDRPHPSEWRRPEGFPCRGSCHEIRRWEISAHCLPQPACTPSRPPHTQCVFTVNYYSHT